MNKQTAILAAGCFWGVQHYFDQVPGVVASLVGYTGGNVTNPTYEMVCTHTTGHAEAVKLDFDPKIVSYADLLRHFFRMHDSTQLNRQGPDVGDSYRSAIFYLDENQKKVAEKTIKDLVERGRFKKPIVTTLTKATTFWPAEDYHQKFTEKTGRGVCHIAYSPIN